MHMYRVLWIHEKPVVTFGDVSDIQVLQEFGLEFRLKTLVHKCCTRDVGSAGYVGAYGEVTGTTARPSATCHSINRSACIALYRTGLIFKQFKRIHHGQPIPGSYDSTASNDVLYGAITRSASNCLGESRTYDGIGRRVCARRKHAYAIQ